MEAVEAGLGGEEVVLGNEAVLVGAVFEELGDLVLIFRGQDGARGVQEFSAGLEHARVGGEEFGLDGTDAVDRGGFESPFEIGLAFQGAEAGAGGIDKQGIRDVLEVGGDVFGDGFRGNGAGAGVFGAVLKCGEFFGIDVHREDPCFVVRERAEMQGFAACARAGIDDALAGFGIQKRGDKLGGGILDFDPTIETEGFGQHFPGGQGEGVGVVGEGGGFNVVIRKPCLGFFAGGDQGVDAEEDRRFLVEGFELGFPEIAEFREAELVEPIGYGLTDGAWLVGEEGLSGEDFVGGPAVVGMPVREFVTHQQPLGGEKRVGFLGIDEEGKRTPPACGFEKGFGDEGSIAFAPFRVLLERCG